MFCVYEKEEIIKMFREHVDFESTPTDKDSIVDYFGVRIPIFFAKHLSGRAGTKIESPPFPSDTVRASFIEYLAIVESIRDCDNNFYQMTEIGASYAPFSAICAKLALKRNIKKVILRPVEASLSGKESIQRNFEINGLINDNIDMRVIQAAVVGKYKDVFFS